MLYGRGASSRELEPPAQARPLLTPLVPSTLAGAALAAFGGGMVRMSLNTPGMTEEGSIRPTQQGTVVAKDVWLLGAVLGLPIEDLTSRRS